MCGTIRIDTVDKMLSKYSSHSTLLCVSLLLCVNLSLTQSNYLYNSNNPEPWTSINVNVNGNRWGYSSLLNNKIKPQHCNDNPNFIHPQLCPTPFYRQKKISYRFVSKSRWEAARKVNGNMSRSSFERENILVNTVFKNFNKLFPWVKFYKASNWKSANIKIDFIKSNEHGFGPLVSAHAHVGYGERMLGTICLHPHLWDFIPYFESTIMHEVLHLMGNADITNSSEISIMSLNPAPTFKDVLTTTYVHFRKNYKKHLVSKRVFSKVEKEITSRYKNELAKYV